MKVPADEAVVSEGVAEVEAEEGEDSEVVVVVVAVVVVSVVDVVVSVVDVVDIDEMMVQATGVVTQAKDRAVKETTRKVIEIRDLDLHEATGVDQGVTTLHVAQMTIIRMEVTAETTDVVATIAMIAQMRTVTETTQTVHPDANEHDDSDPDPQERTVLRKEEKVAPTAGENEKRRPRRSTSSTLLHLKRPTKQPTTNAVLVSAWRPSVRNS